MGKVMKTEFEKKLAQQAKEEKKQEAAKVAEVVSDAQAAASAPDAPSAPTATADKGAGLQVPIETKQVAVKILFPDNSTHTEEFPFNMPQGSTDLQVAATVFQMIRQNGAITKKGDRDGKFIFILLDKVTQLEVTVGQVVLGTAGAPLVPKK